MACNADRTENYGISGTLSDLPAFVSLSQSVSVRVVRVQVIDAAPGGKPDQQERRLPRPRRQALPVAVASVALPVAAASLALAAAPLLRRLPDRLLPAGAASRVRPMLPNTMERAARIRRPPEPLPLDAGGTVCAGEEGERGNPVEAVIREGDGALATGEREPVAPAGVPS